MSTAPAAGGQPETASIVTSDSSRAPATGRRERFAWTVFALIPASVLVALMVLHLMAAGAAAATGGCGGG